MGHLLEVFTSNFSLPGVNFINILRVPLSYKSLFSAYSLALNELLYEKRARKMLMKLTPSVEKYLDDRDDREVPRMAHTSLDDVMVVEKKLFFRA